MHELVYGKRDGAALAVMLILFIVLVYLRWGMSA